VFISFGATYRRLPVEQTVFAVLDPFLRFCCSPVEMQPSASVDNTEGIIILPSMAIIPDCTTGADRKPHIPAMEKPKRRFS
jgi:hypothetical protein